MWNKPMGTNSIVEDAIDHFSDELRTLNQKARTRMASISLGRDLTSAFENRSIHVLNLLMRNSRLTTTLCSS